MVSVLSYLMNGFSRYLKNLKVEKKGERGTHVKPLCVGKDLSLCGEMTYVVTHLRQKY
jgi:hypothetical protein